MVVIQIYLLVVDRLIVVIAVLVVMSSHILITEGNYGSTSSNILVHPRFH